jgi:predicted nucleotidyltransferase component of viral defense system
MKISPEILTIHSESTGFRPDILEKVAHLLNLLGMIQSHPFLKNKLVLKGGTALNLFIFNVPRLSIDIDLNYIGSLDRESMLEERPRVEQSIHAVFSREGFTVRRMPEEHAGGKWSLRYQSAFGRTGNLEVDINFMFRLPLWKVATLDSKQIGNWKATGIPVLNINELVAGKITALLSRHQARDLFDCRQTHHIKNLNTKRLRIAFVVFGAMNRKDWREVSVADLNFDSAEITRQLVPTLRYGAIQENGITEEFVRELMEECRNMLSELLPFTDGEKKFLDLLLDKGEIDPTFLTNDTTLQDRIRKQPLLEWKAINVRQHKGLT